MIYLSGTSANIWPEHGWHTLIFSMMPWNIYKVNSEFDLIRPNQKISVFRVACMNILFREVFVCLCLFFDRNPFQNDEIIYSQKKSPRCHQ